MVFFVINYKVVFRIFMYVLYFIIKKGFKMSKFKLLIKLNIFNYMWNIDKNNI